MIVKDIKLKYCIGVLPINIVFAHDIEENTKSLNDALENKDTGKLVSDKDERKQPTVCSILCEGDSIKKNLTPEEKVPELVKNIIIESNIVQHKCNNSLIETKNNEVKVTDELLLKKIKDEVKDRCILTEIQIGDRYLYFFTKGNLKIIDFVKINEFKKCRETISKNFKDILNNGNKFNVTVDNGAVIIKSIKKSNGLDFMNGINNNQSGTMSSFATDINNREGLSTKEKEPSGSLFDQNPGETMDNFSNMREENNPGENNEKNLDNRDTDMTRDPSGKDKYEMNDKGGCGDFLNNNEIDGESGDSLGGLTTGTDDNYGCSSKM